MSLFYSKQLRDERDCGLLEFWLRRIYSGILYHRIYRLKYPESPYYVPSVVKLLSDSLNKQSKIFEYGSGISTVWYARRVESLIAIEHNEEWYSKVTNWLKKNMLNNVELKHIPLHNNLSQKYASAITKYADKYFDIVAVDGRDRVNCIQQAANKVKIGGMLILDDSHRARYQSAVDILSNYECTRYDFGLLQTTVFRRFQ